MGPSITFSFWSAGNDAAYGFPRTDVNRLLKQLNFKSKELTVKRLLDVIKTSRLLMARDSGDQRSGESRVVGMATLVPVEKLMGRTGRVEDVVVDQGYRGQGIGRRLMELIVVEARRLGLEKLELTSSPERKAANKLYKRLGFKRKDTNVYRLDL